MENTGVNSHDAMIFFNFRPDRAAQLSQVYTNEKFEGFEIKRKLDDLFFVTLQTIVMMLLPKLLLNQLILKIQSVK